MHIIISSRSRTLVKVIGDAAFVPLTRRHQSAPRLYALVDLEDYERVTRSKWTTNRGGRSQYVCATGLKFLAAHHRLLHAYILRVHPGERVDHINGDTFDNRKQNLRIATASQNAMNMRRPTFPGKTSRFKGVCWSTAGECWVAAITCEGQRQDLGNFSEEAEAARAYDAAAIKLFGGFARTNAMMKLFDAVNPFVPDCSRADGPYDRAVSPRKLTPHLHRMTPAKYDQRLTDRLKREFNL